MGDSGTPSLERIGETGESYVNAEHAVFVDMGIFKHVLVFSECLCLPLLDIRVLAGSKVQ